MQFNNIEKSVKKQIIEEIKQETNGNTSKLTIVQGLFKDSLRFNKDSFWLTKDSL